MNCVERENNMTMNELRLAPASAAAMNLNGFRGRRRSSRQVVGGLLGSASAHIVVDDDNSTRSDFTSRSVPGLRSRVSDDDDVQPFDEGRNSKELTDTGSSKKTKKSLSALVLPSLKRNSTTGGINDKRGKQREAPGLTRSGSMLQRASQALRPSKRSNSPKRSSRTNSPTVAARALSPKRPTRKSSPMSSPARAQSPKRPTRKSSASPRRTDDIPELEPIDSEDQGRESSGQREGRQRRGLSPARKASYMRRAKTMGTPAKPQAQRPGILKRNNTHDAVGRGDTGRGRTAKPRKTVSISPPPKRDTPPKSNRSKSPFRRTRSAVDTPTVLRNAKGEVITLDDYDDDDETSGRSGSASPKRSNSPPRRSVSSSVLLATASMLGTVAKGSITKADLSPRIPNKKSKSLDSPPSHPGGDNALRMPALGRGLSLGSAASIMALKRKGTSSPSPDRDELPLRRSRSGRARGPLSRGDSTLGRGLRATKSACSDLAAMQMAIGGAVVLGGGAAVIGGLRATKSACADLADMPKSLGTSKNQKLPSEAQPDPLFEEMVTWNATDPEDRAKFDDAEVKRLIRRNPDALQAKYTVQVGRFSTQRSALSTIVALGASLDTVRHAIKAHPAALKACNCFRSTPLHTAVSFNTDMLVVRYLYHKHPEAIKATTQHVFLPLHNACQKKNPSLETIQFLVEEYPEGLTQINKLGDTPLRIAERNETTPLEVLQFLEEATERVFSQDDVTEKKRKEVEMRQSWGSKELRLMASKELLKEALGGVDGTDHTTISTAPMDTSENSTSTEFAHCDDSGQNDSFEVSKAA